MTGVATGAGARSPPAYLVQVLRKRLERRQRVVAAVQRLVALVAGDLLPLPRLLFVGVVDLDLGEQPREVAGAVVIPLGEVTIFRARRLYA